MTDCSLSARVCTHRDRSHLAVGGLVGPEHGNPLLDGAASQELDDGLLIGSCAGQPTHTHTHTGSTSGLSG